MAYYPVPQGSDDRHKDSLVPIRMRNVMLTPLAGGSARGRGFACIPRPGMVARVTPGANAKVRGLFAQPGFHGDKLYAVAGTSLRSISDAWTSITVGTIAGFDPVLFEALSASLVIVANGDIIEYDLAALTTVMDVDAPDTAETLCIFGSRVVSSQRNTDVNFWSATLNVQDWPSLAFASSEARADAVVANVVAGSVMLSLGSITTQVFIATGGANEEAITLDSTYQRDIGALSRDAVSVIDKTVLFIARDKDGNRAPCMMSGLTPQPIDNLGLIQRLKKLDDAQVAALRTVVIGWGEKKLWVVRMTDGGPAMAYDTKTRTWAEWTSFEQDRLAIGFATAFAGKVVVAGPDDDTIYSLEDNAYDDDGAAIEKVVAFHVPVAGPVSINNITLDIKCHGQPLADAEGEDFVPKALVRYYFDGGSLDSVTEWSDEREIELPAAGDYGIPPPEHKFGLARGANGILVEVTITDPIGFAFYGIWVNELPE